MGIARPQSTASSHVMFTQHGRDFENSVQARILKNTQGGNWIQVLGLWLKAYRSDMEGISKTPADCIGKFPPLSTFFFLFLFYTEAICVELENASMLTEIVKQMFTADVSQLLQVLILSIGYSKCFCLGI